MKLRPCRICGGEPSHIATTTPRRPIRPMWALYCATCLPSEGIALYGLMPGGSRRAILGAVWDAMANYPHVAPGDLPAAICWLLDRAEA